MECRYECGELIPRRRLTEHEQTECQQQPMDVKVEIMVRKMEQRLVAEMAALREEFRREIEAKSKVLRAEMAAERREFKGEMVKKDNAHKTEMVIVREEFRREMEKKDEAHLTEMRQLEKKIKVCTLLNITFN